MVQNIKTFKIGLSGTCILAFEHPAVSLDKSYTFPVLSSHYCTYLLYFFPGVQLDSYTKSRFVVIGASSYSKIDGLQQPI